MRFQCKTRAIGMRYPTQATATLCISIDSGLVIMVVGYGRMTHRMARPQRSIRGSALARAHAASTSTWRMLMERATLWCTSCCVSASRIQRPVLLRASLFESVMWCGALTGTLPWSLIASESVGASYLLQFFLATVALCFVDESASFRFSVGTHATL